MGLNILAWVKAKKYTDNAVSQSAALHREIVTSLPITGDEKVIYMVPITGSGDDNYNEYMWINGTYELIGNTRVDLTDYYNKTQVDAALSGKANTSDIPTALSDLTADSTHRVVTDTEKSTWNGKSNFSGSYNDLSNKPTIPTALSQLSTDASHRTVNDTEKNAWNGTTARVSASSFGSTVTISSYTSSNRYTCPKDGFLNLSIAKDGKGMVYINGGSVFGANAAVANNIEMGMFVKQGMTVYVDGGYKASLFFRPLSY